MNVLRSMALLALVGGLAGPASAQMPYPFGAPPDLGKHPQCTAAYVKSLGPQIEGLEKLRTTGPAFVGQVCSMIESGSALIGGELSDETRRTIKSLLGVDVDLRFIKTQCRVGQGNLDREVTTQLGYLKSELIRCNDTI